MAGSHGGVGMRLSIALTNWNRAWFLERSIFLYSEQTLSPDEWELVVVDDGSTDHSDAVIRKYRSCIKNYHYYRRIQPKDKYTNCSIARNISYKGCSGDYIVFVDPEVMCLPDWAYYHCLAHVCPVAITHDENVIHTGNTCIPDGATLKNSPAPTFNRWIRGMCLNTRDYHGEPFNGKVLGNVYNDYNWLDITSTYNDICSKLEFIRQTRNLSCAQVRNEFFFHIATMGGLSVSRMLMDKINGWEENFANRNLGLDGWAGEDTWLMICLNRQGAVGLEECKARAFHIHHEIKARNTDGPSYASKLAENQPDLKTSNNGRAWGVLKPNYEQVF